MTFLKKKIHHTKGKSKYLMIQPSDVTTLNQINQYNTDKQNLERKKLDMLIRNTRCKWFSHHKCFEYKN